MHKKRIILLYKPQFISFLPFKKIAYTILNLSIKIKNIFNQKKKFNTHCGA